MTSLPTHEDIATILREIIAAITETVNDPDSRGGSGNLLARLSDARTLLSRLEAGSGEETERPIENTSAIVGDAVTLLQATPGLFLFEREGRRSLGLKTEYQTPDGQIEVYVAESGEAFWGGANSFDERDKLIVREVDADDLIRSLAAHPAEPETEHIADAVESLEVLEANLTEEGRHLAAAMAGDGHLIITELHCENAILRARAEKAEAALKQPVSDEEVASAVDDLKGLVYAASDGFPDNSAYEEPAQRIGDLLTRLSTQLRDAQAEVARLMEINKDITASHNGLLILQSRTEDQLRDAQARGKGMEEALKPFAEFMRWSDRPDGDEVTDWHDNQVVLGRRRITFGDLRRAAAARSRPEGSAST